MGETGGWGQELGGGQVCFSAETGSELESPGCHPQHALGGKGAVIWEAGHG